ncbi:MAG: hypothetical protein IJ086_08485 [Clostridium sp.]|nr:hypothetical protein [Clostridium sp.]
MNLNIGKYLETVIRNSGYSKKEICEEINKRYNINSKPISYTTFSNNLKEGNITLNEALALATIIDIDLNKIVSTYKNKYNQINTRENEIIMEKVIVDILNNESLVKGITYKEENVYDIGGDAYECFYLSEDGNTALMQCVTLDDYLHCSEDKGFITEKAYFTNFLNILGELNMQLKDFKELPLNEKLCLLSDEGMSALEILGEEARETMFKPSLYIR